MRGTFHPTPDVLRRLLDHRDVAEPDRRHVARCPRCLDALASLDPAADAAGAASTGSRAGRRRGGALGPALGAVAVVVVLTAASTAAANGWLPIFRAERIAPIDFPPGELTALPDLSAYGEVIVTSEADVRPVADAAAAAAATGLDVPEVTTLPRGISGEPVYQVADQASGTFTFSAQRSAQAAAQAEEPLPPPPPGLDGTTVRLVAGPATAAIWQREGGVPSLVVARAIAPTASSSGVPFEAVRDHLLSLVDLPEDLAAQLRAFTADGSTLPLPVPSEHVTTSTTEVHGASATVLSTRDRTLSAVVWVDDGVVTIVGGSLDPDEVLVVARGLR